MTETPDWRAEISAFIQRIEGFTQEDAAGLDPAIRQRDISRWKRGKYSEEPSGPKMAAIRRLNRTLADPSEFQRGVRVGLAKVEKLAKELRALATSSTEAVAEAGARTVADGRGPEDQEGQSGSSGP